MTKSIAQPSAAPVENFGRNVRFVPRIYAAPGDVNEVLAILEHYRGHKIRVVGRLHSWSDAAVCSDVVVDLRNLKEIRLETASDGAVYAEIGAGATVDEVLDHLWTHGRYTLPTYGIVGKQAMGGAVSTATHGAGRASLSHYVDAVSVAAYDEHRAVRHYRWTQGDELRAARCGIGCAGVLLSVHLRVESEHLLEETTAWCDRLEQVLALDNTYPQQQFYLVPWSWRWYAQLRRPANRAMGDRASIAAVAHRLVRRIGVDLALNGAIRMLGLTRHGAKATRWFFRSLFPLVARPGMAATDRARCLLTMAHDLYRHVEMELFVPAEHVARASLLVEWVLRRCGGDDVDVPALLAADFTGPEMSTSVERLAGRYVHDYPITFRKVLRDDTLISMTASDGTDAWYAISLLTYQRDIEPFLEMADVLAGLMCRAYQARPHWGKVCPPSVGDFSRRYPDLPRFKAHCRSIDPEGAFINAFCERVLAG